FVRDPRNAQEPQQTQNTVARGTQQVLHLLASYLQPGERLRLLDRADAAAAGTDTTPTGQP
ncbi:MAG: TetR family transcriptional regulator, partial [Ramlibacter sp.]